MRALFLLALAGCLSKPAPGVNDHLDEPVTLAAGAKHACRIDDAQHVWCWGDNARGQLGQPLTVAATGTPQLASPDAGWTWIAAGDAHTCGIRDGHLVCWGGGAPDLVEVSLPEAPTAVYAGAASTCAIAGADHHLYCWSTDKPAQIKPGNVAGPWRAISIAADHTCALLDRSNSVFCWGDNAHGQLGGAGGDGQKAEVADALTHSDRDYVAVAAGTDVTCAITVERALECWGAAARTMSPASSDAMPDAAPSTSPIDRTHRWTAVAVGARHVCAVGDGEVRCMGDDDRGSLGPGKAMDAVTSAIHVAAGDGFSCSANGATVKCWGTNEFGELGNHDVASHRAPIANGVTATRLSLGPGISCAIDGAQQLACWGDNRAGQIDPDAEPMITRPRALGSYSAVATGAQHTCAITTDGSAIDCWGDNAGAQLGVADPMARRGHVVATSLAGTTAFLDLAAAARTTCALTDRHELACWGDLPGGGTRQSPALVNGTYGQLALGDTFAIAAALATPHDTVVVGTIADCLDATSFPSTQPIVAGQPSSTALALAAQTGASHVCTLEDGRLTCAGGNLNGQTGQANTAMCRAPAVVPPPTTSWGASIAVGDAHTCALDAGGRLYCWGSNVHGELAAIEPNKTTPQLVDTTIWSAIATGPFHSCGVAAGGNVLCWGENRFGELGIGTSYRADPEEVVP